MKGGDSGSTVMYAPAVWVARSPPLGKELPSVWPFSRSLPVNWGGGGVSQRGGVRVPWRVLAKGHASAVQHSPSTGACPGRQTPPWCCTPAHCCRAGSLGGQARGVSDGRRARGHTGAVSCWLLSPNARPAAPHRPPTLRPPAAPRTAGAHGAEPVAVDAGAVVTGPVQQGGGHRVRLGGRPRVAVQQGRRLAVLGQVLGRDVALEHVLAEARGVQVRVVAELASGHSRGAGRPAHAGAHAARHPGGSRKGGAVRRQAGVGGRLREHKRVRVGEARMRLFP